MIGYHKESNQRERFHEITNQLDSDVKIEPKFVIQIVHKRIKRQIFPSATMVPSSHEAQPIRIDLGAELFKKFSNKTSNHSIY